MSLCLCQNKHLLHHDTPFAQLGFMAVTWAPPWPPGCLSGGTPPLAPPSPTEASGPAFNTNKTVLLNVSTPQLGTWHQPCPPATTMPHLCGTAGLAAALVVVLDVKLPWGPQRVSSAEPSIQMPTPGVGEGHTLWPTVWGVDSGDVRRGKPG
jgi:hypothetical protein